MHQTMIAIRLINSPSTSVSDPNMENHMMGKYVDICGKSNLVGGGEYKPRGWGKEWVGGGREVGGWGVGKGGVM